MQAILDPRRLRGYLAAANVAAHRAGIERRPQTHAQADADERGAAVHAVLLEAGALAAPTRP